MLGMLTEDDHAFLSGPFDRIEGWCHAESAAATLHLQRWQAQMGWSGPNYEIGVYKGKYLSVLHRAATLAGHRTLGIDIFRAEPISQVSAGLERELGSLENLSLIERNSATIDSGEILDRLGGKAAWISIDGDHNAGGVLHDLRLAEATLAPAGVVALDDFINGMAIGVTEAAIRYLTGGATRLRPFSLCAGKLLLAFEDSLPAIHAEFPRYCEESVRYPRNERFMSRLRTQGEEWTQQGLCGQKIWLLV